MPQNAPSAPVHGAGSGFFISPDGYVVTNNQTRQVGGVRSGDTIHLQIRREGQVRDVATTRETFRFLGVAARPGTYVWRVLQGYADGKVKPWTGLPERPGQDEGFESGPTAPGPADWALPI